MRTFQVIRHEDIHGNTGTGVVAEGAIFSNGRVAFQWIHEVASMVWFMSIEEVIAIHGHDGKTVVIQEGSE